MTLLTFLKKKTISIIRVNESPTNSYTNTTW